MSMKLRDLIRAVRACKTAADERSTITKECALIRTAFKDDKNPFRHRNVAKLLYIHMLGYPSHFGQMECLKLIASNSFAEKRIGYLALMLLVDEATEVLMLVTNSLKMDLHHQNQYVVGLALTAIGNIASADIARDLSSEVERHLRNTNHYIRKKAALACTRIFFKVPELVEDYAPRLHSLLSDGHHSVLLTGVTMLISATEHGPACIPRLKKMVPSLVKVLRKVVNSNRGRGRDYEVGNVCDPFLQSKLLSLLRILGEDDAETSELMRDVLTAVSTHTDTSKNAGNAIMYDCVKTIMSVQSEPALRVLGINRLGTFLTNKDNNIRYVGLQTLCRVARTDLKAVRRHRPTIVACLRDPDVSIRRRASELVFLLVDEESVEALTREMVNYLRVAGPDDRAELCAKVATIVDNHSPSVAWQIDTLITMLAIAGDYCRQDVQSSLLYLVSQAPECQAHFTHKLYAMIVANRKQLELVHAALWCIGEFGETLLAPAPPLEETRAAPAPFTGDVAVRSEAEVVGLVGKIMKMRSSTDQTKGLCLSALLKLTGRYFTPDTQAQLRKLLTKYSCSLNVELQQRSVEFFGLAGPSMEQHRDTLLAPMPILDEGVFRRRRRGSMAGAVEMGDAESVEGMEAIKVQTADARPEDDGGAGGGGILDLDDLFGGGGGGGATPTPATGGGGAGGAGAGVDILSDLFSAAPAPAAPAPPASGGMDLFGGGHGHVLPTGTASSGGGMANGGGLDLFGASASPAPAPAPAPAAPAAPAYPDVVAYDKAGVRIVYSFSKPQGPDSPVTVIDAKFSNANPAPLDNFALLVSLPRYLEKEITAASAAAVPPNNSGVVTQRLKITNTQHKVKPLLMRIMVNYTLNGQQVSQQHTCPAFPAGL